MSLFSELRNRNVFRVAAAYVFTAWLAIQVVETIFPAFGFGDGVVRVVVIILAIGLRQARERKQVLDVVCTDNPYAEIWQPSEATCGR